MYRKAPIAWSPCHIRCLALIKNSLISPSFASFPVLLQTINNGASTETRQCFVCSDEQKHHQPLEGGDRQQVGVSSTMRASEKAPRSCLDFDRSDSLEDFVRDCPEGYLGCSTEISGNSVKRGCDTLALDDCKIANGVRYCYCKDDLCNRQPAEQIPFLQRGEDEEDEDLRDDGDDEDDDEEYGHEYSGLGPIYPPETEVTGRSEVPSSSSSQGSSTGHSTGSSSSSEKNSWSTTSRSSHQNRQLTTPPSVSGGSKFSNFYAINFIILLISIPNLY